MPIFMDTHERVRAITPEAVRRIYERSLEVQSQYGARYQRMWAHYDADDHGRLFCLVEAPSREAVVLVHLDAHGLYPNEIQEVVEAPTEAAPDLAPNTLTYRSVVHA
ncbi:MAG: DUF4242 domain-containing protein [Chloroflexi bacterium]|nr:DUF4242 domain-containing protein [Chloroflexota bacterium]